MSEPSDTGHSGHATQAMVVDDDQPALRSHKIILEIVSGPDAGTKVELPGPEVRIGGGTECDLTLSDRAVSRHHVTVRVQDGHVRVQDMGSRNGTRVDGLRIFDCYARADSTIALGRTTLRLQLSSDWIALPLSTRDRFGAILGSSVAMRRLFAVLERAANTDTTVLIEGETGTGKELIAEALHDEGRRSGGPFVVFDCSAVSPQLMESELFGHVRGAFTGAHTDRKGAMEAAEGGTLFLDEIGELPLELQPKLLRALERLEVKPVGAHKARQVDVRIVAATNRSLAKEMEAGRFREDLYYRLAVVRVQAPPLRERPEDIPVLARHFASQFARRHGTDIDLPDKQVRRLAKQSWPGNVRELKNAVMRILSVGPPASMLTMGPDNGPDSGPDSGPDRFHIDFSVPLKQARDQLADAFERAYVIAALEEASGNVTRAAELAGVHRKFIHRAIERYGLREHEP